MPTLRPSGAVVIDTSGSPHAALHPVPISAVELSDTFWKPRIEMNRTVTIPAQYRQCEETGRIDNFRIASGRKQGEFRGIFFNDSDVYKWTEAAAWSLAFVPDPELEAQLDAVIDDIAAAQSGDGYLNTYFTGDHEGERFTNLKDMHEIYCAGHLIQAAVAHRRATGKTTFLAVAERLANCLYERFGPGHATGACGHEEAEMALVELYRATGERRHLDLAISMVEARGRHPGIFGNSAYHQDHLPFAHQSEFTGHAVRHLYYTCGAADAYAETGRADWMDALQALWSNLTAKRMFVTGGAGSRYEGEAFGADYELPNDRAYTETCAAIASVMWNWRMLNITGEARFADLMELTLYNAVLPGLSLDGAHYFYQNPLADRGTHRRQEWFGCACCPPNVARTLASIAGYFASVDDDGGVYLHMYAAGTVTVPSPAGGSVSLDVRTEYPWDGNITITITDNSSGARSMYLRVPAWAANAHIEVNGMPSAAAPRTYAQIPMPAAGSSIKLVLPMPIERVESHPHVLGNLGRVTLRRGPLVYCIEQADHPDGDVWNIALPDDATLTPEYRPGLLGGVTVLRGQAVVQDIEADAPLYRIAGQRRPLRPVELTAIPYYAWANREPGAMAVWMPRRAVIVEAAPTPRSSSL